MAVSQLVSILRIAYAKLLSGEFNDASIAIQHTLDEHKDFDLSLSKSPIERLIISLRQGEFSFKSLPEARIQYWSLEQNFPHHPSILLFLSAAGRQFENFRSLYFKYYSELKEREELRPLGQPCWSEKDVIGIDNGHHSRLIICYAGLSGKFLGLPWNLVNEFYAKRAQANLLILKDRYRARYLYGVESLGGGDPEKTFVDLNKMISSMCSSSDITIIGSSGGSFGALIASCYIGCENVICLGGKMEVDVGGGTDDGDRPIDLQLHKYKQDNPDKFSSLVLKYVGIENIFKPLESLKPLNSSCQYSYLSGRHHESDYNSGLLLSQSIPHARLYLYETSSHMFMNAEFKQENLKRILGIDS